MNLSIADRIHIPAENVVNPTKTGDKKKNMNLSIVERNNMPVQNVIDPILNLVT